MFDTTTIDFRRKDAAIKSTDYLRDLGWENFEIKPANNILPRSSSLASLRTRPSILLTTSQGTRLDETIQEAAFY